MVVKEETVAVALAAREYGVCGFELQVYAEIGAEYELLDHQLAEARKNGVTLSLEGE